MAVGLGVDGLDTDFYPPYVGQMSFAPIESDTAPYQPTLSPQGAGASTPLPFGMGTPSSGHMPLLAWALIFIGGAFVLMHIASKE